MTTFIIIALGVAFTVIPFISSRDEDIHLYEAISLLSISLLIIVAGFILKDQALIRVLDVLITLATYVY